METMDGEEEAPICSEAMGLHAEQGALILSMDAALSKQTPAVTSSNVTASQSNSPFFNLPPELRNHIYRFCLVDEEHKIIIYPSYKLPALLSTSRLIRSEAIEIYLLENQFERHIPNCNTKYIQAWIRNVVRPLGAAVSDKWRLQMIFHGVYEGCRAHLLDACHAAWEGTLWQPSPKLQYVVGVESADGAFIAAALDIAWTGRASSWYPEILQKLYGLLDDAYEADEE